MEQTSQYQFSQWAETDRIQREDFNADNFKADQALSAEAAARQSADAAEAAARLGGDLLVKVFETTLSTAASQVNISADFYAYSKLELVIDYPGGPLPAMLLRVNSVSENYSAGTTSGSSGDTTALANLPSNVGTGFPVEIELWACRSNRLYSRYFTYDRQFTASYGLYLAEGGRALANTLNLLASSTGTTIPAGTEIRLYGRKK